MKNAKLWKMILNNGAFYGSDFTEKDKEYFNNIVIRSHIIVDTRDGFNKSKKEMSDYGQITIPFNFTWIESSANGMLYGCVFGKLDGDDNSYGVAAYFGGDSYPVRYLGRSLFVLTKDNYINTKAEFFGHGIPNNDLIFEEGHSCQTAFADIFYGCLDTLDLLSCKNVGLKPNPIEQKQAARAAKRHGGNPGDYRYHTLVVHPPGVNKSTSVGQDIGNMPRHVCRGHFSEYGPEFGKGLLFGKYAGRFFIPPHMKGKKENGIIEKDYEIRTQS